VNPQEARERAEQEAADQAEERRVAREDLKWAKEVEDALAQEGKPVAFYEIPPYLFADERSQRRVEEEARHERPLDDYAAWTDQNEQLFR
jgi:hypothetical protein